MGILRNRIRKGLEKIVAPLAIGAGALFGSYQEAKAQDTNNPSYFILYAQADQVIWSDPSTLDPANTNIWKHDYSVNLTNSSSYNVLVGSFLNTGKVSDPVLDTEKMKSSQYSFALTDITQSNKFTVNQGIIATNGVWGGSTNINLHTVTTSMVDNGFGAGIFGNNNIGFNSGVTNWVTGDSLSSAILISLKSLSELNLSEGYKLKFEPDYPTKVFYVSGTKTANTDPEISQVNMIPSGFIFVPEPSTNALMTIGGGALAYGAWRRRRRKNCNGVDEEVIERIDG